MLLKFINNSIHKFFEHDPDSALMLHKIKDQTLLLKLTDIKKQYLITPSDSTIIVNDFQSDDSDTEPNATVYATVLTSLRLALGGDYQSMLENGALRIEGDVELANQLRAILKSIDIDWEEIASKYVGDAAAYQMGVISRRINNYRQRSVENFRLDVSEYLQEESRIVPTKIEIEQFLNSVDELDADIDRLEMRTNRLLEILGK